MYFIKRAALPPIAIYLNQLAIFYKRFSDISVRGNCKTGRAASTMPPTRTIPAVSSKPPYQFDGDRRGFAIASVRVAILKNLESVKKAKQPTELSGRHRHQAALHRHKASTYGPMVQKWHKAEISKFAAVKTLFYRHATGRWMI